MTRIRVMAEPRDLEARFAREVRALRQRLHGRHPRETFEQFAEPLVVQLEATLERYGRLFTSFTLRRLLALHSAGATPPVPKPTPKRSRGRPPKPDPPWWTLPAPKKRGKHVKYDPQDLVQWVDAHKAETGGRVDADALREGILEALQTINPAKHRLLEGRRQYYLGEGCTPPQALRQAVSDVEGSHFLTLKRFS